MARDICFVIDEMIAVLSASGKDPLPSCFDKCSLQYNLLRIKDAAKTTAPEAMFLRWSELDSLVASYRTDLSLQYTEFLKAYLHKWE